MTFRPYEVGDRIRNTTSGATGTVVKVPAAPFVRSVGMAHAQHHLGITIRWDEPRFGITESRHTIHAGGWERI